MKKILQAIDSASTEVSSSEMHRLRTIVEGKGPLNRLTAAESIAVAQYTTIRTTPVLNVTENATPSMISKYFKAVEEELQESATQENIRARQLAERVSTKINELSTDTLAAYKKAAGADARKADAEGDFERGNKRFKGIVNATKKQFANDAKTHGVKEAEGEPEGVAHLTKELLTHIVQQSGKEGAHAVVKSLQWGDGAAKELLHLIINDLKDDIQSMDEGLKDPKDNPCWTGYKPVGTKKKGGKTVPNCVPKE